MCLCLPVSLSFYLSACLSARLSVCWSSCLLSFPFSLYPSASRDLRVIVSGVWIGAHRCSLKSVSGEWTSGQVAEIHINNQNQKWNLSHCKATSRFANDQSVFVSRRRTDRETDREADRETDIETKRRERQTGRQTDRQTDRETERRRD